MIGITDTTFAALALWLLFPGDVHLAFPAFLVVFVMATVLGVVSHVPGGLGVFEAVILLAVPSENVPEVIGSLLLFRLVYYVGPFALAAAGLGAQEVRAHADALNAACQVPQNRRAAAWPRLRCGGVSRRHRAAGFGRAARRS